MQRGLSQGLTCAVRLELQSASVSSHCSMVEEEFELLNGLIDLNRDIVMKLLKLIEDEKKCRNIIGMASAFYEWSKQSIFRWARTFNFLWSNSLKSKWIEVSNHGRVATAYGSYDDDGHHIILLHHSKIKHGVASVSVKVEKTIGSMYFFGVLLKLPKTFEEGFEKIPSWGLQDNKTGIYHCGKNVVVSSMGYNSNGDIVKMRVDVDKGDLEYTVNKLKGPSLKGEARLKEGVYLAAQLYNRNAEWTIVSADYHCYCRDAGKKR